MPDIVLDIKKNILSIEAEIRRAQSRVKKNFGHPLRLEESAKELRALNVRLGELQQNLASETAPAAD